jgi:MarR family transcriptional regulator, organic hydroperoxide resistance regulator
MSDEKIFTVDTPEESSGFLLWQVTNLWQREIRKVLEPLDLTHSQFVLLVSTLWLTKENELITQVVLSSHTKIDPMTTSTVLRTLQKKGLIQRIEHETDTRAKTISLTEAGTKLAKVAVKTVEKFDHDFFAPLGIKTKDFNGSINVLINSNKA